MNTPAQVQNDHDDYLTIGTGDTLINHTTYLEVQTP